MARIELAPEIVEDFDRILDHLAEYESQDLDSRVRDIVSAIDVLERNPCIGRITTNGNRELVIGRSTRGDVALYRYASDVDAVLVLAVRSQREAGYSRA